MRIEYMKMLRDNPQLDPNDPDEIQIRPYKNGDISEINKLKDQFNHGYDLPRAFEELLFLGGEYNYALPVGRDFGPLKALIDWQLQDNGDTISRPIFPIYREGSDKLFFYSDEMKDDPDLYTLYYDITGLDADQNAIEELIIEPKGKTLTQFVEHRIKAFKQRLKDEKKITLTRFVEHSIKAFKELLKGR